VAGPLTRRVILAAALVAASCGRDGGGGAAPRPASADPWSFACGSVPCDGRTTYCEVIKTDAPELPSDYACKPLPAACKGTPSTLPTCDCFPAGTRCDYCVRLDKGEAFGFRRMCVGGR
jgi:hypothetical protein